MVEIAGNLFNGHRFLANCTGVLRWPKLIDTADQDLFRADLIEWQALSDE
jgi:hypothetical protein